MDKKSKVLYSIFFTIVITSIGITFVKYFVLKDYEIRMNIPCNPQNESCFVYECEDGEMDCEENGEGVMVQYYKVLQKKAYNLPSCMKDPDSCENRTLVCAEDEELCEIFFCDASQELEPETYSSLIP